MAQAPQQYIIGNPDNSTQIIPIPSVTLTANVAQTFDFSLGYLNQMIGPQQAVYVDNSANDCLITCADVFTQMSVICPARCIGWFPLLMQPPVRLRVTALPARPDILAAFIQLAMCNRPLVQGPTDTTALLPLANAAFSLNVSGPTALVNGAANQTIRIHELVMTASGLTSFNLLSNADTKLPGTLIQGVPLILPYSQVPHIECAAGAAFNLGLTDAVLVQGFVRYRQTV